jgi:hypothetical protein
MLLVRRLIGILSRLSSLFLLAIFLLDYSLSLLLFRYALHHIAPRLRPAPHLGLLAFAFIVPLLVHVASDKPGNDFSIIIDFIGRIEPTRWKLAFLDTFVFAVELTRLVTMLMFHGLYFSAEDVRGLDVDSVGTREIAVPRTTRRTSRVAAGTVGATTPLIPVASSSRTPLYPPQPAEPPDSEEPPAVRRRLRTTFPPTLADLNLAQPTDDELLSLYPTLVLDPTVLWRVVKSVAGKDVGRWRVGGNSRGVPV